MKTICSYKCEICGRTYNDAKSALECEGFHVMPKNMDRDNIRFTSRFWNEYNPYPLYVWLPMEDGKKVKYQIFHIPDKEGDTDGILDH